MRICQTLDKVDKVDKILNFNYQRNKANKSRCCVNSIFYWEPSDPHNIHRCKTERKKTIIIKRNK